MRLERLGDGTRLWCGGELFLRNTRCVPTGYAALDRVLPGGGWPLGGLTEILSGHRGIGALRLLMPALAELSGQRRWLAWVAPPHVPYAPALLDFGVDVSRVLLIHSRSRADTLWSMEQALRSGTCGAVLAWPEDLTPGVIRRLQLAAESGDSLGVVFRPRRLARAPSPAALRLRLSPRREGGLNVEILKSRGGWPAAPLTLPMRIAES